MVQPPYPVDRTVVESQVGPLVVETHGFAGGLTSSQFAHWVNEGVKRGCPRKAGLIKAPSVPPALSMVWSIERAGSRPPSVTVTARLLNGAHPVSFSATRTEPPGRVPHAVFKRVVADIACSLFLEAGYLRPASPDG